MEPMGELYPERRCAEALLNRLAVKAFALRWRCLRHAVEARV